jgi:hypothetical protein
LKSAINARVTSFASLFKNRIIRDYLFLPLTNEVKLMK